MQIKITQLEVENVKRVKAVTLAPTENGLTVIGGRNNQGKTSVLDSIMWTLGGDRYRPSNPQRDGSVLPPKTQITLSDGTIVKRSGKNSSLTVIDPSGKKAGQQLLNSVIEQLALDMPKFMSAGNQEKAKILLRIIGLEQEVNDLERLAAELYNKRHAIGQIADQKMKHAKELPEYPDAPMEPVSAFELIQKQQDILAQNGENQRKRARVMELAKERDELRQKIVELEGRYKLVCDEWEIADKDALELEDIATDELEANIRDVEAINTKVRTNQAKARAMEEAMEYKQQYNTLSTELDAARKKKLELLNNANLPLPGLSVENGTLTYNGKPWDCMSGSDQLKVSAAIVRALKPQCGFVLLDKLEQMDLDTLREFGDWMANEGLQGIATRVSTGGECSLLIEDGCIAEPETPSWSNAF